MSGEFARLREELLRVSCELKRGTNSNLKCDDVIDIVAHPEALMWLQHDVPILSIGTDYVYGGHHGPPGAFAKMMGCWMFADPLQPAGALIIRLRGKVYSDVPCGPTAEPFRGSKTL